MTKNTIRTTFLSSNNAAVRTSANDQEVESSFSSHDLRAIQANESWLQETPRNSLQIASHVFGLNRLKEFEMTFFDSFSALEEGGYRALEGVEQGFENLVWEKA